MPRVPIIQERKTGRNPSFPQGGRRPVRPLERAGSVRHGAEDWDAGYLTDQRGFSDLQSDSHRMQSFAVVFPGQTRPDPPATGPAVLSLVAKAGDPLVGMAADIDFVGTFTVSPTGADGKFSVSFDGKIDDFPAYECYATFKGVTKKLFTKSPPPGNTVTDLLGFAKRPFRVQCRFPER